MQLYRGMFDHFDTVYIGGGTPSVLNPEQMKLILDKVDKHFSILQNSEITCEINPGGNISPTYLDNLHDTGINRINIGVQSFDEHILTFLGRKHSASEAIDTFEKSRKSGFKNIGLDLIYGIPGQDVKSWTNDVHKAISYEPEHLSCYQLTLEPDTPLGKKYNNGSIDMPDDMLSCSLFFITSEILEKAGYIHYEVSNFARNAHFQSRHNQKYWDHTPYLGLGPASHSFLQNRRWWNHRSISQYINFLNGENLPIGGEETLDSEQLRSEEIFLGLRTKRGIDLKTFRSRYGYDLLEEKEKVITGFMKDSLLEIKNNRLCPTLKGMALADSIYLEL
jgi:oxygen-independent coproporphyrinogen-3 oxidase